MRKKLLFTILSSVLLLPSVALAETVTTNTNNVPLQINQNNSQVILLIPNSTSLEKTSQSGEWYKVTYQEKSGWINRSYTSQGLSEKQAEEAKKQQELAQSQSSSSSSAASYSKDATTSSTSDKMKRIVAAVNKYGKQYDLDPLLILALIQTESSFNPNAKSYVNCRGLMQISYQYAPEWGIDRSRLYEIEYNIQHGTRILRTHFIKYMGNLYDGLRAYNYGVNGAKSSSSNGKGYADKIMKYYKKYQQNGFTY